MRIALLSVAALALSACGGETAKPAAPVAETPAPAPAGMDDAMKASDAADDANTAETMDGTMFHTDTTKTEKVHLPAGGWTATPADATQVEIAASTEEAMPDGAKHLVFSVHPLTRDVIATVKFERREGDAASPVVETRTVKFMIH